MKSKTVRNFLFTFAVVIFSGSAVAHEDSAPEVSPHAYAGKVDDLSAVVKFIEMKDSHGRSHHVGLFRGPVWDRKYSPTLSSRVEVKVSSKVVPLVALGGAEAKRQKGAELETGEIWFRAETGGFGLQLKFRDGKATGNYLEYFQGDSRGFYDGRPVNLRPIAFDLTDDQ